MRVLVTDDSINIRIRIRIMLEEQLGIDEVLEAANVSEAEAFLSTEEPDILVLDIGLGGESGLQVLKFLNTKANKRPVTIMFTNHATSWYRRKCLSYGADYFLDKAYDFEKLQEVIAEKYIQKTLSKVNPDGVH